MVVHISTTFLLVLSTICVEFHSIAGVSNSFYIVTSPDNHCRRELTGDEPCLTLQQYAYDPSLDPNVSVSLTVESGTHLLHGARVVFSSEYDSGIPTADFSVTGERAKVIYDAFGVHYYSPIMSIRIARHVAIHGVSFVSNNKGFVKFEHIQEVVLEHCSFQGVRLCLNDVKKAIISNCGFTRYSHQSYTYRSNRDHGAIFISNSMVSIAQSNFSTNRGAVHYHNIGNNDQTLLEIVSCIFSNNTSDYGGSAILIDGPANVLIQKSVFLSNSAAGSGGAIHYTGTDLGDGNSAANLEIVATIFVYNYANFCGALSVEKYRKCVNISDSTFYYNRAVNFGGDGGAVCTRNASVTIYNSTFVANAASGDAGALQAEGSNVTISSSIFSNNSAQRDGGALFTSAHPSNYTIMNSVLTHNKAGDDGGAVFMGRKGSHLKVERSSLVGNLASDRGGAMAIFGSKLDIKQSNVQSNLARYGKSLSACNSFVGTFIPGKGDPYFPTCTIYDDNLAPSSAPPFHDGSYSNVAWLNNTVNKIITVHMIASDDQPPPITTSFVENTAPIFTGDARNNQGLELRQTSIISYASLAVSGSSVLIIALLICIALAKATCCKCKIKRKKRGYRLLPSFQDHQTDSDDEELLDPSK